MFNTIPNKYFLQDQFVSVNHRLGLFFTQKPKDLLEKRFDDWYVQQKGPIFLRILLENKVFFRCQTEFSEYIDCRRQSTGPKSYIRITNRSSKKVYGYVVNQCLVRAFRAWKKEQAEKLCQRCGDRHLTIDCPWILFPQAAVRDRKIHEELMLLVTMYRSPNDEKNQITKIVSKEMISDDTSHSKPLLVSKKSMYDKSENRRKRGRPKKLDNSESKKCSLAATFRAGIVSSETNNKHTCYHCQEFMTDSYAELFHHMKTSCHRKT